MKLYHHTCQNPACCRLFETKRMINLYCCKPCATEVNRNVIRGTRTGKRKSTSGIKRGNRIYAFSGL